MSTHLSSFRCISSGCMELLRTFENHLPPIKHHAPTKQANAINFKRLYYDKMQYKTMQCTECNAWTVQSESRGRDPLRASMPVDGLLEELVETKTPPTTTTCPHVLLPHLVTAVCEGWSFGDVTYQSYVVWMGIG